DADGSAGGGNATGEDLAATGAESPSGAITLGLMLLLGGALAVGLRRRMRVS
ncbi:MAG TPA: cell wall anchor protein, partial [Microbacterium sp.]|nr:cell wall anchor protein [Microbacterium sp.]